MSANKNKAQFLVGLIAEWWETRRPKSRGNIAGGLVLLEHLRANFNLDIAAHKASGSDQLRNATIAHVQKILARHGEKRTLLKEGGRTNRGLMKNLGALLHALSEGGMQEMSSANREEAIDAMQKFLVQKAQEALNAPRLVFEYRGDMTSSDIIGAILTAAGKKRMAEKVAEYLVGAQLALRFPDYEIRNSTASAADDQTAEKGDFQINDTVFHVAVAPGAGHYDKCERNLADGLRVFLLVPDDKTDVVRGIANEWSKGRVAVRGIESFISQSVEKLAEFAGERVVNGVVNLLGEYNKRVAQADTDTALLIKIPFALAEEQAS